MGFLIDDCAPQTIDDTFFHSDIYKRLKVMSREDDIPHIIVHGEEGCGKRTMVKILLDMIYNGETRNLNTTVYKIPGSGSKVKEEIIEGSRHHIIIRPTGTNFDRYLVHNVIKTYACSRSIMASTIKDEKFRIIQIANLDKLSTSAQNSLRRMIETNSTDCRFVMWANNLSNVIEPLKSRGFCIRVPMPTDQELFAYLAIVSIKLGFDIGVEDLRKIVSYSNNNIKKALWCIQAAYYGYSYETNYDTAITMIVELIMKCSLKLIDDIEKKDIEAIKTIMPISEALKYTDADGKLSGIRDRLFNLMITNYAPIDILKSIMDELLVQESLSEKTKMQIIMQTTKTEYDMVRARREIIHFDAYVSAVMRIIHTDRTESVSGGRSKVKRR